MKSKDFFIIFEQFEKEKKVDRELFLLSLEAGLASAYKKEYGETKCIEVKLNPEKNGIRVFAYRTIVEEVIDNDKEISLEEARKIKPSAKLGATLQEEIEPRKLSRIAIQTAMQVVKQRLSDANKVKILDEISEKKGEILNAIVRRIENDRVYVELVGSQLEGTMLSNDKIKTESYYPSQIIKVYVKKVESTPKGVQVLVSRSTPEFVEKLFQSEVPEIRNGTVIIKNIVREAGDRTKLSVYSDEPNFDPVGALIGPKSTRISSIINELNGEKVDIIKYENDPADYIQGALSPARVSMTIINEEDMTVTVIIPDDKKSLAIGKRGQNVRLAAKLTGWKIDIKSQSEYDEEFKASYDESMKLREENGYEEENSLYNDQYYTDYLNDMQNNGYITNNSESNNTLDDTNLEK